MRDNGLSIYRQIQEDILKRGVLDPKEINLLPRRWKRIGHVLILDLKRELTPARFDIGSSYLRHVPRVRTVLWRKAPTDLTIRKPHYEIIAGERNTVTVFKENGVRYIIDAAKLTFSAGNHHERLRLVKLVRNTGGKERILDMFACVGNLSMPLAVHVPTVEVVGIELNPLAYSFLRKTIRLNHVQERYHTILGDNRKVPIDGYFDRILMGYFGISDMQLERALKHLNPRRGGWLHVHELRRDDEMPELPHHLQWLLKSWNEEKNDAVKFKIEYVYSKRVKWVGPRLQHLVSDVKIVPIF